MSRSECIQYNESFATAFLRALFCFRFALTLLINMGYSALAIGDRVGHEAIAITYRYAHLFPSIQSEMAMDLDKERTSLVGFEPKVDRRKAGLTNVSEKEGREESLEKSHNRFQVISGRRNRA